MTDVERSWFQRTFLGEDAPPLWRGAGGEDNAFEVGSSDAAEGFGRWLEECNRSRLIVDQTSSLDAIGVGEPYGKPVNLRWIMQHMIQEYARHNGHADLIRERIDGSTGT
jgi:hypothetical protein